MSELAVFFKQNKPVKKNEFFPVCADFKDKDGKVINWELRHLSSLELGRIRSQCMTIQANGKRFNFDGDLYNRMIASHAVVFPDLKNAELVDSYMSEYSLEDRTPENLICLIVDNDREFQALVKKVNEMNGSNSEEDNKSLVETAKN